MDWSIFAAADGRALALERTSGGIVMTTLPCAATPPLEKAPPNAAVFV